MDRKVAIGLLKKLGSEGSEKVSSERAKKKLTHRLQTRGVPDELTDDERLLVAALGFALPAKAANKEVDDEEETDEDYQSEMEEDVVDEADEADADEADDEDSSAASKKRPAPPTPAKEPDTTTKKPKASPDAARPRPKGKSVLAFIELFKGSGRHTRSQILEAAKAKGLTEVTARTYLSWAKQDWKANPFGFHLTEEPDSKGEKVLKKIPTKTSA